MPVNDPSNLLQRIPELNALASDSRIGRAIGTGDSFKVYRALCWARLLRRLPAQRGVVDALLRNRRFFAKPAKGTPLLGSINSVGFGFVGSSEEQADGTHIAMHALVVLFALPLVPLRSYVVKKTDSSLLSSSWNIFARVPSSMPVWLSQRALALALAWAIGSGVVAMEANSRIQDVIVVNGFDVPATVVLDGKQRTIAPMGHATITVQAGPDQGEASIGGVAVDSLRRTIEHSSGHTIWNIAGAAPVFEEKIQYSRKKAAEDVAETKASLYCGQQFIELGHVDDLFSTPPDSVAMRKRDKEITRVHVDLATEEGLAGYSLCANYLLAQGQAEQALPFLEAIGKLKGWDEQSTKLATQAASANSPAEALRVARRAVTTSSDAADVQHDD